MLPAPSRSNLVKALASLLAIAVIAFNYAPAWAQSPGQPSNAWTQFRGQQGTGVADAAAAPPVKWDLATDAAWQTDLPGVGWSTPVYEHGKIWLTSAITQAATPEQIAEKLKGDRMAQIKTMASSIELHAICLDLETGAIEHDIKLTTVESPEPINPMNSYASPTPAIKDGKVVVHFGNYGTWCLDEQTGKTLWQQQFVVKHSVGPGSSPVIFGDKVLVVCDGMDLQYIVGLDLATGKEIWRTSRPPMKTDEGEFRKAYCTPLLIEVAGQQQAVIPGAQWTVAYNPETGAELWRVDYGDGFSVTPMPVFEAGLVIFSTGYPRAELVAIDPSGSGDVTTSHLKWRSRKNAPTMPSLIARDGQVFSLTDKGILNIVDAKTGELTSRQRIGGNYSSSPLLAADKLYVGSREGNLAVIDLNADMKTIATNNFDGSIMASPILVGDDLLVRTEKQLIRIKKAK